jgi:hypothetical protein
VVLLWSCERTREHGPPRFRLQCRYAWRFAEASYAYRGLSSWSIMEDDEFLRAHTLVPLIVGQPISGDEESLAKPGAFLRTGVLHPEFAACGIAGTQSDEEAAVSLRDGDFRAMGFLDVPPADAVPAQLGLVSWKVLDVLSYCIRQAGGVGGCQGLGPASRFSFFLVRLACACLCTARCLMLSCWRASLAARSVLSRPRYAVGAGLRFRVAVIQRLPRVRQGRRGARDGGSPHAGTVGGLRRFGLSPYPSGRKHREGRDDGANVDRPRWYAPRMVVKAEVYFNRPKRISSSR